MRPLRSFHTQDEIFQIRLRELKSVLCDNLEGWDGGEGEGAGEFKREGTYVYLWLIHVAV